VRNPRLGQKLRIAALAGATSLLVASGSIAGAQSTVALERKADSARSRPPLDRPARLVVGNVPIAIALVRLGEASGVPLAFSPSMLQGSRDSVDCDCGAVTVAEALEHLLAGTGTGYTELGGRNRDLSTSAGVAPFRNPSSPDRDAQCRRDRSVGGESRHPALLARRRAR